MFLVQAGVFFIIPLFLSVVLGMTASQTGVRLLPLSVGLLVAAMGIPKRLPNASPRRVCRIGLFLMIVGIVLLMSGIDLDAAAAVVLFPMLLIGLGLGSLASQLGAVTVAALPEEKADEVGGLQNTATQLGASFGTALAGLGVIAILTTSFLTGVTDNPAVPPEVKTQANTELAAGVPFISDADLEKAMQDAGMSARGHPGGGRRVRPGPRQRPRCGARDPRADRLPGALLHPAPAQDGDHGGGRPGSGSGSLNGHPGGRQGGMTRTGAHG